ncbi:FAD-binding oxidoreductase [Polaromonas sp. P1(28)-13]|nr:FAD-binding oxidoreductase [Polaromonas sp. P1(28)-13]
MDGRRPAGAGARNFRGNAFVARTGAGPVPGAAGGTLRRLDREDWAAVRLEEPREQRLRTDCARAAQETHGVAVQTLSAQQLREMDPALAEGFVRGLYFPENAHTVDPLGLVNALVDLFVQAGGQVKQAEVRAFGLRDGKALHATTVDGPIEADAFVLAAGLASAPLATELGDRIPMQGERGYHVMLPDPRVRPAAKVGNRDQMFGMTPMRDGVRISGTVEITGPDTPPDMRRAQALLRNAKLMYPGLNGEGATFWSGNRPSTPDSLPVIDRSSRASNVIHAFGHGHSGLTGAPVTARIVAALAAGRQPDVDATAFRGNRF